MPMCTAAGCCRQLSQADSWVVSSSRDPVLTSAEALWHIAYLMTGDACLPLVI